MSDTNRTQITRSDNTLRDRIAAVIRREVPCHPPAAARIADAVIAELGKYKTLALLLAIDRAVDPDPVLTEWKTSVSDSTWGTPSFDNGKTDDRP